MGITESGKLSELESNPFDNPLNQPYMVEWVPLMKTRKCPHCGSTRITTSPSGEHLLCLGCQRILVQPRDKGTGKDTDDSREPGSGSTPESVNQLRG